MKSLLLLPQRYLPIIGAAWTLSYEIFFYLLFGIVRVDLFSALTPFFVSLLMVGFAIVGGSIAYSGRVSKFKEESIGTIRKPRQVPNWSANTP